MGGITQCIRDIQCINACDTNNVAGLSLSGFNALKTHVAHNLQHFAVALTTVAIHYCHRRIGRQHAPRDTADPDDTDIAAVVEGGNLQLQRAIGIDLGRCNFIDNGLEQWRHIVSHRVVIFSGNAVDRRGIDHGKIELLFGCAQRVKQVKHLIDHPVRSGARAINLVHHDNRIQSALKRFSRNKAGLWHRPINRIDQQQH